MLGYTIKCDGPDCKEMLALPGVTTDYEWMHSGKRKHDINTQITGTWIALLQEACYTLHFHNEQCLARYVQEHMPLDETPAEDSDEATESPHVLTITPEPARFQSNILTNWNSGISAGAAIAFTPASVPQHGGASLQAGAKLPETLTVNDVRRLIREMQTILAQREYRRARRVGGYRGVRSDI